MFQLVMFQHAKSLILTEKINFMSYAFTLNFESVTLLLKRSTI